MHVPLPAPRGLLQTTTALGVDAAWFGVRVAGYPFGVRPAPQIPAVRSTARPGDWHEVPVILVHGVADNRSAFAVLRSSLRRRGFRHVSTVGYPLLTPDLASAAHRLAAHVEEVCAATGADRVHVVGHSLGGLVARWYVQRMGGEARVDTLVAVGTPHAGTHAARLLPLPLVRQLLPGSAALRALAAPMPGCRTRIVSVWSTDDEVVLPRSSARLVHPDLGTAEVRLTGIGHFALVAHPRVLAAVAGALHTPLVDPVVDRLAAPTADADAPALAAV